MVPTILSPPIVSLVGSTPEHNQLNHKDPIQLLLHSILVANNMVDSTLLCIQSNHMHSTLLSPLVVVVVGIVVVVVGIVVVVVVRIVRIVMVDNIIIVVAISITETQSLQFIHINSIQLLLPPSVVTSHMVN